MAWVWTVSFCALMALGFTLLGYATSGGRGPTGAAFQGWVDWYGRNFIVTMTIGAIIHVMFDLLALVLRPQTVNAWPSWGRTVFFAGVPLAGLTLGWPLGMVLAGVDVMKMASGMHGVRSALAALAMGLVLTFVIHHFFLAKTRQIEAERRATEAQLRLLQAQMEPHFLFNTLANVQTLIDHDPPRAREMLETFTDYLRATLTQMRTPRSTVGAELDLAETYLKLLQTRMEDRLNYTLEVDAGVRDLPLPSLTLQPLVENAIHHGLEPKVEGGTVNVRARRDGERLVIEVIDDGLGPTAAPRRPRRPGSGVALANLRERLQSVYRVQTASLVLEPVAGPATGTRVALTVPLAFDRPPAVESA
jgi:two-component sensor histidine kinase